MGKGSLHKIVKVDPDTVAFESGTLGCSVLHKIGIGLPQRRYDMRHEMLTQRAPFCIGAMAKKGMLSQHFVTHVVPPLGLPR